MKLDYCAQDCEDVVDPSINATSVPQSVSSGITQ
jgi:hypothetical protein